MSIQRNAELINKSKEAMLAAVQLYNNPLIHFKSENFIMLVIVAWTYLLHAYYNKEKIDHRYWELKGKRKKYSKTKYGAYKHWELGRCLSDKLCPLDNETKSNLGFLIQVRNEIEHQKTDKIDENISAKLQANAINYNYYLCDFFGERYSLAEQLALSIQFSPIITSQKELLLNNDRLKDNVKKFIVDFETNLDVGILGSPKYSYKVCFVPISTHKAGQADSVINFISAEDPLAKNVNVEYALLKETEKKKYLPSEIVTQMKAEGFEKFNVSKHTKFWKEEDAKNPKKNYGVNISKQWYWYDSWVQEVRKNCKKKYSKEV